MPRASKILNPAVVDRIVSAIERGCTYSAAASAGPIAESTFHAWLRQAELDRIAGIDTEHTAFADRIEQANASAERVVTELWFGFCATDYRACRDFLSRRFAARWGPEPEPEPDYASDEERATALADAMEHWLATHNADA